MYVELHKLSRLLVCCLIWAFPNPCRTLTVGAAEYFITFISRISNCTSFCWQQVKVLLVGSNILKVLLKLYDRWCDRYVGIWETRDWSQQSLGSVQHCHHCFAFQKVESSQHMILCVQTFENQAQLFLASFCSTCSDQVGEVCLNSQRCSIQQNWPILDLLQDCSTIKPVHSYI